MGEEAQFVLRCELRGHDEDVRALCLMDDASLLTASRDKMAKLWAVRGDARRFEEVSTLVGHTDYVTAIACVAPGDCEAFPRGAVVTGSRDASVVVWDPETAAPVQKLKGHQYQVTAVVVDPLSGDIYSCSLDKTIRVWRGGACVRVLEGHQGAVLCLLRLPSGELVSGSGDQTIRVWTPNTGACTATLPAHTDSVRGLALLPNVGVVSASHDQTVKLWTLSGECIVELVGHTSLVYCAAAADEGLIASGSEDNTAKLWRPDGTCLQTIQHPGNVWAVAFLPSGDLVTACSDGAARVWTRAPERAAPAEEVHAYEAGLAACKAAAAQTQQSSGGGGGDGLPTGLQLEDPSLLNAPGAHDGQTKVVHEGGAGVAYTWDGASGRWERIGEVVGGPTSNDTLAAGSKYHAGQMWDYVFDVDVAEGTAPRKLALNARDNPYLVADRFLEAEDLPVTYREQIVQYILQNTGGQVTARDIGVNPDPYTGAGAYVPGASTSSSYGLSTRQPSLRHVPARTYLVYDSMPGRDAIRRKLAEFNAVVAGATGAGTSLSEAELAEGGPLDGLVLRATAPARSNSFVDSDFELLAKLLTWPAQQLFPVLDLTRLLVLDGTASARLASAAGLLTADGTLGSLGRALAVSASSSLLPAAQQTAVRLACNCFGHAPLLTWAQSQGSLLLEAFAGLASSPNKAVRQGLATLLLNFAVASSSGSSNELVGRLLGLAVELINSADAEEVDTRFRALVGVGTLLCKDPGVKQLACDLGVQQVVASLLGGGDKVAEAACDVQQLL